MQIDLLHTGPVLFTHQEPLNKFTWKAQDDQEERYKINYLELTYLAAVVCLGPGTFFCCLLFLSSYAFANLGSSGNDKLWFIFCFAVQMLTNADCVAVPHMLLSLTFSHCSIPGDPCSIISVSVSDRHFLQVNIFNSLCSSGHINWLVTVPCQYWAYWVCGTEF